MACTKDYLVLTGCWCNADHCPYFKTWKLVATVSTQDKVLNPSKHKPKSIYCLAQSFGHQLSMARYFQTVLNTVVANQLTELL
jgi:hypothetical protein